MWRRYVSSPERWAVVLVTCGLLIRLVRYLQNPSVWMDEARLALNILNRNYMDLLQPLAFKQGAPVGFLWIQKTVTFCFGPSEYALRLAPLLIGMASVILFWRLARGLLYPRGVLLALVFFALASPVVHYSMEAKPYGMDLLTALVLNLAVLSWQARKPPVSEVVLVGVCGAVAIWLSYSSIFVLSGIGFCLFVFHLEGKPWITPRALAGLSAAWAASFAASYLCCVRQLPYINDPSGYPPLFPFTWAGISWFARCFTWLFYRPIGLIHGYLLAALLFCIGCFSFGRRQHQKLLLLVSPALFALAASYLHRYLLWERMMMFFVPALVYLLAEGLDFMWRLRIPRLRILGACFAALLIGDAVVLSAQQILRSENPNEIKPIVRYLMKHRQAGDHLYVASQTAPIIEYYWSIYNLHRIPFLIGRGYPRHDYQMIRRAVWRTPGRTRMWFVFSLLNTKKEKAVPALLRYIDTCGDKLDFISTFGARAYLYDLDITSPWCGEYRPPA